MTEALIRPADPDDHAFLVAMLVEAFNWNGQVSVTAADVEADPALARYLSGWPRPSDFGVIATSGAGEPLGAAWARQFGAADPGYGFVHPEVPEIGIGVVRASRGRGVGTRLLTALIAEARDRSCTALSLSVADGNRARVLYERVGFVRHCRNGDSDTMICPIPPLGPTTS
ncbi:MAG: GNAT family N-acetyltransferase [Actinomycetota bacterium]|nr:GNAT family N-acetyltransferase [Actinomycetota bacterium]